MVASVKSTDSDTSRANALSVLGVRLIALYLILAGLSSLPTIMPDMEWATGNPGALEAAAAILEILAPLIVGIVLWLISGWVGRHVAALGSLKRTWTSEASFLPAGIAVTGFIVAVTATPGIVKQAIDVFLAAKHGELQARGMIVVLGYRVLIGLLGLALLLGAAGLRHSLFKLRDMGTR